MKFNNHSRLEGSHAFLSASKYHWIRYDNDKLINSYVKHMAVARGTELHDLAAKLIKLGQKLPKTKQTLNRYVNDAIGFKMDPEVLLFYSYNCYGTADSISFRNNVLRIHDLKTGTTPAHVEQLMIYAALFCLEYKYKPGDVKFVLRIYQFDDFEEFEPETDDIAHIMDKIVQFDELIENMKGREE